MIAAAGGIRPLLSLVESRYPLAQRCSINALAVLQSTIARTRIVLPPWEGLCRLSRLPTGVASPEVQAERCLRLQNLSTQLRIKRRWRITVPSRPSSHCCGFRDRKLSRRRLGDPWALSEDHPKNKVSIASAGAIQLIMQLAAASVRRQTV